METTAWLVELEDGAPDPAYLVTGHRGRTHMCAMATDTGQVERVCERYHVRGYQHLRIIPIVRGAPIDYLDWLAAQAGLGVTSGR